LLAETGRKIEVSKIISKGVRKFSKKLQSGIFFGFFIKNRKNKGVKNPFFRNGVQEVESSNLFTPTRKAMENDCFLWLFSC